MGNDTVFAISWWLNLFLIGIISIPTSFLLFRNFIDKGWAFTKTIGILILSYLMFLLAIFNILPFTKISIFLILASYAALNIYLLKKHQRKITDWFVKNKKLIVFEEIVFASGYFFWAWVRAHQPDINGLEKFMDYGFINSALRSEFLPPADMWFAGEPINYYWFGHFSVAFLTKLTNIASSITYNLMIATIAGISLVSAFAIAATLIKKLNSKKAKRLAVSAGLISAFLLVFSSNFHTPFYILKEGRDSYWYPDATRFIGYNPETNDKTIHEFPSYSFVVSDLHAHLINLPFVLLYIALLYSLVSNDKWPPARRASWLGEKMENLPADRQGGKILKLVPLGLVLGVMFITSTWDFGNYLLLTGFVFLMFNIFDNKFNLQKAIPNTAKIMMAVLIVAGITALPFVLNFKSIAEGIRIVNARSPLWQLAILWGLPAVLTVIFISTMKSINFKLKRSDIFVASMLITSWVLIFIPEVAYVKDIYIASHHRANTMFKLTYQAHVMFSLSAGYIAVRSLKKIKKPAIKLLGAVFYSAAFLSVLYYSVVAINSYYADLKNYKGLSGDTWLEQRHPEYYQVTSWFNQNVDGQPHILEAPGDSYTEHNVVSSYTGLPTISGWFVHEWLWRGDSKFPQERVTEITQVYTSNNLELTRNLIEKYDVEYIIFGSFERQKYPNLNEEKFESIGEVIFSSGSTRVYKIN